MDLGSYQKPLRSTDMQDTAAVEGSLNYWTDYHGVVLAVQILKKKIFLKEFWKWIHSKVRLSLTETEIYFGKKKRTKKKQVDF